MTLRTGLLQSGLLNQPTSQTIDGSLRFNQTSKNYLTRTPSSVCNRKVWTLSFWTKLTEDTGHLFSAIMMLFNLNTEAEVNYYLLTLDQLVETHHQLARFS